MIKRITSNKLFKDLSWSFISSIICNLLQFGLIFFLLRLYSKEEFGLWASITSIAAVIITGDFGIVNVLRFIVSRESAKGKRGNYIASQYFYSAMIFLFTFTIIASLTLFFLRNNIPIESLFKTDNIVLKAQSKTVFLFVQFIFLLNLPLGLGIPLFFSYGETKIYVIINLTKSIISFLTVVVLGLLSTSIVFVCIAYFIINAIITLLGTCFFIYRRKWYSFVFCKKNIIKKNKEMFSSGIKFLGVQLSSSFIANIITIYASSFLGLSVAANVNIVQKIFSFIGGIYQSLFNPIWGELGRLYQSKELIKCRKLIQKSLSLTCIYFTLAVTFVTILRKIFIIVIAGKSFDISSSIFISIGLFFMIRYIFENASLFHNAINKMNIIFFGYIIMALYSFFILPYIITNYGIIVMILNIVLIWTVLTVYTYIDMINKTKTYEN